MNTTEVSRHNNLAHGWQILETHLELSEQAAKSRASWLRQDMRGTDIQVRTGSATIKKHGASIVVWVVVKRRKLPKGDA